MAFYAHKRVTLKSSYPGRIVFTVGVHNSPTFLYDALQATKLADLILSDLLDELKNGDINNYN